MACGYLSFSVPIRCPGWLSALSRVPSYHETHGRLVGVRFFFEKKRKKKYIHQVEELCWCLCLLQNRLNPRKT
jgi:hypothetical protein